MTFLRSLPPHIFFQSKTGMNYPQKKIDRHELSFPIDSLVNSVAPLGNTTLQDVAQHLEHVAQQAVTVRAKYNKVR